MDFTVELRILPEKIGSSIIIIIIIITMIDSTVHVEVTFPLLSTAFKKYYLRSWPLACTCCEVKCWSGILWIARFSVIIISLGLVAYSFEDVAIMNLKLAGTAI